MSEHLARNMDDYEKIIVEKLTQLPNDTNVIEQILATLEDMEENININRSEPSHLITQIQLICYLIQHDLENAKFFCSRQLNDRKENESYEMLHKVLIAMWQGEYKLSIQLVERMQESNAMSSSLKALIAALHVSLVSHTLKEIAMNYKNLPIAEFKDLLALKTDQETFKLIQKLNWASDEQGFLFPDSKYLMDKESFKHINEEQINQITKLVSFLDSLQ